MKRGWWLALIAAGSCAVGTVAAAEATRPPRTKAPADASGLPAKRPAARSPTLAEVPYGDHPRQVLDFWRVESASPTPLLFFIHGGGWVASSKNDVVSLGRLTEYLNAGISVVSINYRFVTQALEAGVKPPVQWPLHDAARSLQFVRSKAQEWNLDKTRIAATGFSAGACSSLWLAFHADMADPRSADPIARESTRLFCAGVNIAQTTLDPRQMQEWTPNSRYGGHAFGFMPDPKNLKTRDSQFAQFLAARDQILPWINEYSPFAWVSPDDPPIYLSYRTPPALGHDDKDPTHTANFGVKLAEKLQSVGVECELVYPGLQGVKHALTHEYLIDRLKGRR